MVCVCVCVCVCAQYALVTARSLSVVVGSVLKRPSLCASEVRAARTNDRDGGRLSLFVGRETEAWRSGGDVTSSSSIVRLLRWAGDVGPAKSLTSFRRGDTPALCLRCVSGDDPESLSCPPAAPSPSR